MSSKPSAPRSHAGANDLRTAGRTSDISKPDNDAAGKNAASSASVRAGAPGDSDRLWRNALDLLLVTDAHGDLHAFNPAWSAQLGYGRDELAGRRLESFVHPDDHGALRAALAQAAQAPLGRFEIRMRHKDGSERWIAWNAAPEDDLIYASGRDVTVEKRQAEQALHASETRLRLALEAGEMGVWEWDLRSDEVCLLQGADLLHGLPPSQEPIRLPSMRVYMEKVHPDDRPGLAAVVSAVRSDGKDHRAEYRILRSDGSQQWIEARGIVYSDEHGRPARMSGVSVNITRRKRIEQDLKFLASASAELSALVDPQNTLDKLAGLSVPAFADWCAVDLLSEDGTLERVAMAHADPVKVELARELHARFPPDPAHEIGIWSVLRSGSPCLLTEVNDALLEDTFLDPEYRAAIRALGMRSYIGVPLLAHGRAMGVVSFISAESGRIYEQADLELAADLARRAAVAIENARLYDALQRSDQSKDVFLATLAHELRNPLAAIWNGLGILRLVPGDVRRVEHATAVMERQVNQLRRLVDDLMDVSRIATGKIELRKEDTDLVSIITSAIETTRPMIEAARHRLSVALPSGSTQLQADPVRLAQVFANLLNNAARYSNEGGQIDVALDALQDELVVRVRDNGIGIPADQLKSIFTIFRQGTHPLARSHGGLGIGLSLVEGLVRLHGGRVEAFSAGPGQGSEFVVHLPRGERPIGDMQAEVSALPAPGPVRRVLVVDDNVDAAATVAELLHLLGHEINVVHDGMAAVTETERWRPDLVLLDIGLPGIDGYEAARRIRNAEGGRRVELVALTGWGQVQDRERALRAGFDQHRVKPIGLEQLREILGG